MNGRGVSNPKALANAGKVLGEFFSAVVLKNSDYGIGWGAIKNGFNLCVTDVFLRTAFLRFESVVRIYE
jgi:hypothetical protein